MKTAQELTKDELDELKSAYFYERENSGELPADITCPEGVSDDIIFAHYAGTEFTDDDFFCNIEESVPLDSPWGEVYSHTMLCDGVFSVNTPSHGGIMANIARARSIFSTIALTYAFRDGDYFCFEEDCAAPVALRELMDRGLYHSPFDDPREREEYNKVINECIQCFYPDYWEAHEAGDTSLPAAESQSMTVNKPPRNRGDAR